MRPRVIGVFALAAALHACGGKAAPTATPPACPALADHLLELANRDNEGVADPELAAGIRGEFERQCESQGWSGERRRCLAAAREQDQTLRCPER